MTLLLYAMGAPDRPEIGGSIDVTHLYRGLVESANMVRTSEDKYTLHIQPRGYVESVKAKVKIESEARRGT